MLIVNLFAAVFELLQ